ncbi:MAG TPA: hypothetical protein PLT66_07100 [Bacillota bacterium]|jgi:hypothetical protein|nr:hypothetical protein [Bacillota bacterium]
MHAIPPYIMCLIEQTKAWKDGSGYIELRSGKAATNRFQRGIKSRITSHAFPRPAAPERLCDGRARRYRTFNAMERGGRKTKSTLNRVYPHTLSAERQAVDKKSINT